MTVLILVAAILRYTCTRTV